MKTYFPKCSGCKTSIKPSDLPNDSEQIINLFLGKKILDTYCSTGCLKKHFKIKQQKITKKFLFFKYTSTKNIWVNNKQPKKHFKVIFDSI